MLICSARAGSLPELIRVVESSLTGEMVNLPSLFNFLFSLLDKELIFSYFAVRPNFISSPCFLISFDLYKCNKCDKCLVNRLILILSWVKMSGCKLHLKHLVAKHMVMGHRKMKLQL